MHFNGTLRRGLRTGAVLLLIGTWVSRLCAGEVNLSRTNWVERWITNLIEVRMPSNRFVNEYRTNWVAELRTNSLEVYATNRLTRTLTNRVVVEAIRTNIFSTYHTNWTGLNLTNEVAVRLTRTNLVERFETNWMTLNQTNQVVVRLSRTNLVESFRTNWAIVNLTNYQTVVRFKTNWIYQTVTNVVAVDVTRNGVGADGSAPKVVATEAEPADVSPTANESGLLILEAARTTRPAVNNVAEVELKVRWVEDAAAPLHVQQWRVESANGAVSSFGQDREFKRELPLGKYKVEVKVQRNAKGPVLAARGTLLFAEQEAFLQPKLTAKR